MQQGYDKFFKQARKAAGVDKAPRFQVKPSSTKTQLGSPEAQIKKAMQRRISEKKAQRARAKAPFPVGAFVTVGVGLAVAVIAFVYPQSYEWVMNHVEIGVYGQAHAADQKAAKPADSAAAAKPAEEKAAVNSGETKVAEMPDTRGWTPEETSFFNKLSERKRELDMREAELAKLDEELQKQRVELDEKLKQLEATRKEIAQTLRSRVDNDTEKVNKLVDVYSGMKPQQAAKVIETVDEDLAIQILDRMKKKSAAEILNVMDAKKAQRLSEMLAGYKGN